MGPRITSMRSMSSADRLEKSNSPSAVLLASMPSISTSVWLPSAPRMRTCVKLPKPPLRLTATPGRLRSASAAWRTCCARSSSPVTTVTALPIV